MKNITVEKARVLEFNGEKTTVFDMTVNDVTIYNCRWICGDKNGKSYEFVGFPNEKGKDGKYYNRAYVKLTDEETEVIKNAIKNILCPM